jgi:hypothetical protein
LCFAARAAVVLGLGPGIPAYALALLAGGAAYVGALYATHAFSADEVTLVREAARSLVRR